MGAHHRASSPASIGRSVIATRRSSRSPAASGICVRRRQRGRERVWHATRDALDPAAPSFLAGTEIAEGSARQAAALVVLELAYADPVLTPDERDASSPSICTTAGASAPAGTPPAPAPEEERRTRFADYARRLRQRVGRAERARAGGADVDRRLRRRRHRRARGSAHAPRRRAARARRPASWRTCARRLQAQRDRVTVARRAGARRRATSGSRASATSSRSSRATARTPSRPTCATCAAGRVRRVARACAIRARSPGRCCATSSTCSRISGSARPPSGARSPPSAPTTASWWAKGASPTIRATGSSRPAAAGSLPDTLTVREIEALLAAPGIDEPLAWRDRALLELGYGAGHAGLGAVRPRHHGPAARRRISCGCSARAARSGWCRSAASVIGAVSVYLHQLRPELDRGQSGGPRAAQRARPRRSRGSGRGAS